VPVEGDDCYFIRGTDPFSPENEAGFKAWAEEQAVIDYAGHAAVVAFLGVGDMTDGSAASYGAGSDFGKACERLGNDQERIQCAKDLAVAIVSAEGEAMRRIAEELIARGELTSDQVDWLIHGGTPEEDPFGELRWPSRGAPQI
jgi:hypothetical protein